MGIVARVLFALGLSGDAGAAIRWSAPLKAAALAVSALALSGCLVSSKNLGDDFGTATPMPAGTYLDLVANKTEQVTLSNGGYTRADGTRIKLFGIQGTDIYIVQQAPSTVGGDMTYAYGRVSGDTLVVFSLDLGTEGNSKNLKVPPEFAGRISGGEYGYKANDPSATAAFLMAMAKRTDTRKDILFVMRRTK